MTAGIGIASVGVERRLRSGRVRPVAGWLDPKLNIEPIIAISAEGAIHPGPHYPGAGRRRAPLLEPLVARLGGRPREPCLGVARADRRRNKRLPGAL